MESRKVVFCRAWCNRVQKHRKKYCCRSEQDSFIIGQHHRCNLRGLIPLRSREQVLDARSLQASGEAEIVSAYGVATEGALVSRKRSEVCGRISYSDTEIACAVSFGVRRYFEQAFVHMKTG